MFLGVVHANARKILRQYVPHLPANAQVICSGNFSIETTLRLNGHDGVLRGCDVSIYTCQLGAYFAGDHLGMEWADAEGFEDMRPIADHLGDQEGCAAAIALALDMLRFHKRQNHFNRRWWSAYARRLPGLMADTKARLQKKKEQLRLDAFHVQDGWEVAGEVPEGDEWVVLTFPPTYAGGYEKLYEVANQLFRWPAPGYKELTSGGDFARRIIQRPGPWVIGAEKPDDELESIVGTPQSVSPRGSDVNVSLYTNLDMAGMVVRRQIGTHESFRPRLDDTHDITAESELAIHRITSPEANYIRQLYVSTTVGQASADFPYAVTVDGKIVGLLMWSEVHFAMTIEGQDSYLDRLFLMADLAVPSVRYRRLAKLILALVDVKKRHHIKDTTAAMMVLCDELEEWLNDKEARRADAPARGPGEEEG